MFINADYENPEELLQYNEKKKCFYLKNDAQGRTLEFHGINISEFLERWKIQCVSKAKVKKFLENWIWEMWQDYNKAKTKKMLKKFDLRKCDGDDYHFVELELNETVILKVFRLLLPTVR